MVVNGRSARQVSDAIVELLDDPQRAAAMGAAGREWVEREWTWAGSAARLRKLLDS